jgi:hypothetical protein
VGQERGPLSLMSTTDELLGSNSSGSGLESREYGRRDPPRWPRNTILSAKVGTNFVDKRRSLGRYSSLADSGHVVSLRDIRFSLICLINNFQIMFSVSYPPTHARSALIWMHNLSSASKSKMISTLNEGFGVRFGKGTLLKYLDASQSLA